MNEPRLPQIDPVTFAALNTLDGFVGRAALTRQEHAEANKAIQHVVQTVEMLQAAVRQMQEQSGEGGSGGGENNGHAQSAEHLRGNRFGETPNRASEADRQMTGALPHGDGGTVVAEVAEEIFRQKRKNSEVAK
jgi:hypothetical protein